MANTSSAPFSPGARSLKRLGFSPRRPDAMSGAFPDGGLWRVEIPSVEGPAAAEVVISEAARLGVPVHRISQGSGVTMLTDGEITEMVLMCRENGIELCLFARPGADWDIGAARFSAAGSIATRSRGLGQLGAAVAEIERGAALGVTSFLISDEGLLWAVHRLRAAGKIPLTVQFKTSIMSAPANPASFLVNQLLGADTINVPSDLTVDQLGELRAAAHATIDFYLEAPDGIGGFMRYHEVHEIVRHAAPLYLKFGLRNAPDIYPAGAQLAAAIRDSSRERVRRARLGLDQLHRSPEPPPMSPVGSRDQNALQRFDDVQEAELMGGPEK
jgi:hypothetical protein